jgi:hypothetical protein
MKQIAIMLALLTCLLVERRVPAQGTLEVSNLGQSPGSKAEIGSDMWIAQEFFITTTDPNTYALDSVQLLMDPMTRNASGFSVSIYGGSLNGPPLLNLGSLSGSDNPSTAGTYTYTSSGITLSPGTAYYVVASAGTPISEGAYVWSAANSFTKSGNWNIDDVYFTSSNDGATWSETLRQNVYQMAIFTTPVPEPSVACLISIGGVGLLYIRGRYGKKCCKSCNAG